VRIGRITDAEFRAAMAAAQAPGQRLGQALIAAGVLDPTELAAAVTGQVERIVFSVLRWTKGQMQCRGMDRPLPLDLLLDLNTPRILLLGARTFSDAERLEGVLGGSSSKLSRLGRAPFDYEALPPSPPERAVLALCARPTTLGEVLRLPHPRPRLVRAVYALLAGEMVSRGGAADAPRAPAEAPLPTPQADPEPEVEELSREEVEEPAVSSPATVELRARDLLEKGRRPDAVELLTAVVAEHPEAVACRRLLATARAHDGGFDPEVERLFLDVLELEPGDVGLRYRLATYYRRAGMRARAMLQLRLVLSSDPGHAGAWRDLGELEAGEGSRSR
jgi:predicted Zn-dependent protease